MRCVNCIEGKNGLTLTDKKPKYINNIGWRYATEHNGNRRCRSHQYNGVGTYLVTIAVEGRRPLLGSVSGSINAHPGDSDYPAVELSPLGEALLREELPKMSANYPMVEIWKACIMPDHIHLIIRISAPLPPNKYLGNVIGAFKGGVSRAWGQGTVFEEGYNDRILMRDGQLANWKAYLEANPFRWLVRHMRPGLMQRALCLEVNGVRYGAFGNFMLLRHPEKVQVFFHRRMADDRLTPAAQGATTEAINACGDLIPTEQTLYWQNEHQRLMDRAERGDVLVTPGISECEKRIKNECLQQHHHLIHLQTEPIGSYWKPERSRFEACAAGTLLILSPWKEDLQGTSDYGRFHNLNNLAASICALDSTATLNLLGQKQTD